MQAKIIDITRNKNYENYLYRCLAPMPLRKYKSRNEYLEKAIDKGFHKKLLIFNNEIVGQIEYAPPEASGYPIIGDNIIVLNCIWVLRKAKGHAFGKILLEDMINSEIGTVGFVTIGLENHWSPWFMKWQMEKLGFRPVDSIKVSHRLKRKEQGFGIYLMWMPMKEKVKFPAWDKQKILEGITFCFAHTLYRPQTFKENIFEEKGMF